MLIEGTTEKIRCSSRSALIPLPPKKHMDSDPARKRINTTRRVRERK